MWRGGSNWTHKHEAWLAVQRFDEPALRTTFEHYRAVVLSRDAQLAAVEADLLGYFARSGPHRAGRRPKNRPKKVSRSLDKPFHLR